MERRMNANSGIVASYPLSPMQLGMLYQCQLAPDSGIYIQQWIGSFREELDISAFIESWKYVVSRHPILKTAFQWEGLDEPRQVVHSEVEIPFETQDWRNFSSEERQNKFEE